MGSMRMAALMLLLAAAAAAQESPDPAAVADPRLRAELLERRDQDQRLRRELVRQMNLEDGVNPALGDSVAALDRRNTARMKEILATHGWPGEALVGADGSRAAWVLVQHGDQDPSFQKLALELLGAAVEAGQASGRDLAFLTDRVRTRDGRPQVYGTQTEVVDCRRVPYPIEDPDGVDRRRAAVGLGPLQEYLELRRRQLGVGPECGGGGT